MTKPVTVLAPIRPNIIGVIRAPELVALMPRTPWNTSGVNRIDPNIPNAVRKLTIMLTVKVAFLNSSSGTIGCSTRVSMAMKATIITTERARRPTTGSDVHAWSRVMVRAISSGTTPAARVNAPRKSMSRHDALDFTYGRPTATTATARMPTGMLTSKTQRQFQWSVIKPPAVGPTIDARPNTPPKRPWARPRALAEKRSPITENTVANRTPP